MTRTLLIGVDVGGTNTDSVLIDPLLISNPDEGVISWNKAVTTKNISDGIQEGITSLFKSRPDVKKEEVASVTIGTTHFINALIEQDESRLANVAVLRLCGPYSHQVPPFSDFPTGLRHIMEGHVGFLKGGYHVDGRSISDIDEAELLQHVEEIRSKGIKSVVVIGVFASLNHEQELKVKDFIVDKIPDCKVVMSHQISGVGFIERENASIINASILPFAEKIIRSFVDAVGKMGLHCPVLLTQNDGTVLPAIESLSCPIKTFASGTTNSMRGASFLGNVIGKTSIVVDVGGTTADVGLLLPSGFPRQSSSFSTVAGVRINFSMPHVESMGLGGGSIVREIDGDIFVGPDSVGSEILKRSIIFDGDGSEVTASDVAVSRDPSLAIGDPSKVSTLFSNDFKSKFASRVESMLENIIDRMKTSPQEIAVLAVGGGSFIVPPNLKGASEVIRPKFYNVANAIGAAMGKVSSEVHCFHKLTDTTKEEVLSDLKKKAISLALEKGALESSIEVVFVSAEPIPYVDSTFEFIVKTIADVDYHHLHSVSPPLASTSYNSEDVVKRPSAQPTSTGVNLDSIDYINYRPVINDKRQWVISEVDLELLRIGTYILGCGGGGDPYPFFLAARNVLRQGGSLLVVDVNDVQRYTGEDGTVGSLCCAGSPTVSNEQLEGPGMVSCIETMNKFSGKSSQLVFPVEIGGSNGLCPFRVSSKLGVPVVDCDLMGRAYPTHWQTIPSAYSKDGQPVYPPTVISNGNGNTVIISESKSDFLLEKVMRASLSELGCTVDLVNPPMSAEDVQKNTIHGSLSLSWRIGRAVRISRQTSEVYRLPEIILDAVNGSGELLFKGKIVGVERKLMKGHVWGEVTIEELDGKKRKMMRIPFKNENILATIDDEVVCTVPDLIAVIDADTGEAVGTPDYRYGLIVFVLGIAPSNKWTDTARAIEVGGPKGFDLIDIEYKPLSTYSKPLSVIDEFANP